MPNEVLQGIAQDITRINQQIVDAKELISAMAEAGEEVGSLEADLRTLEVRKNRWETMLKARGISIT